MNERACQSVTPVLLVWIAAFVACLIAAPAASCAPLSFYAFPDTFVDEQADTVQLSQWRGKSAIVTMEYSAGRFLCTTTFSKLRAIQAAADAQHIDIDFVIVSLDPKNDTPEAWRQYRMSRDVDRPNWHMLTGSEATTRRFAGLIGIKYWSMDEHILHDFKIVRLNEKGEIEKEITDLGDDPLTLLR